MNQRGRKSHAALELVAGLPPPPIPQPPEDFTAEQAELFNECVAAKPLGWFAPHNLPLLITYCQQASELAWLRKRMAALKAEPEQDTEWKRDYKNATLSLIRISGSLASLATKMRLTQQSSARAASQPGPPVRAVGRKPWET